MSTSRSGRESRHQGQGPGRTSGAGKSRGGDRLANPYGLSTWNGSPSEGAVGGDVAPAPAPAPAPAAGVGAGAGAGGRYGFREAEPRRARHDQPDQQYDPLELPTAKDPFELARRTVNRSRAAARDRGLFPISAKTQARDVRDRSGSAPGYSGARPDPRDPQGIESVLRKVLGNLGWNAGMNAGRVLEEWDDIVGERISSHCHPVSLEDGVLVVSASSSAWASQLRMLTPQLVTAIEKHVGSHVIAELRVTGPAAAERTWKKGRRTVTWRGPRDTYG